MSLLGKSSPPLPKSFYLRNTLVVARDLLGKGLYLKRGKDTFLLEIVETEAYLGSNDPGCHANRGMTKRNSVMFESGGACYVYLIYGMYYCMNVVTEKAGVGSAVLLRAGVPILGIDKMVGQSQPKKISSGPGRLTRALGIDSRYNGLTFDRPDFKIIDLGKKYSKKDIEITTRIGLSEGRGCDLPYRFHVRNNLWVSR